MLAIFLFDTAFGAREDGTNSKSFNNEKEINVKVLEDDVYNAIMKVLSNPESENKLPHHYSRIWLHVQTVLK